MNKSILTKVIAWLLILLFSYAAISKLIEYKSFISQMKTIDFLENYAGILAWLIPLLEILIAVLLVRNRTRLTGLYGSFFLMLGFTIYIFVLLHFGTYMVCSCGGIISKLSMKNHLWFNGAITMLSGVGIYILPSSRKTT